MVSPWQTSVSVSQHHPEDAEDQLETYLLLLLSDSNLPTGGFVASSGLESFFAHGFLHNLQPVSAMARYGQSVTAVQPSKRSTAPSQGQLASSTLSFAKSTLHSYCRSSFPFLVRVHTVVSRYLDLQVQHYTQDEAFAVPHPADVHACIASISWLDYSYHTLLLNQVARRASKAQGIALLTLYSKAFAQPVIIPTKAFDGARLGQSSCSVGTSKRAQAEAVRIKAAAQLIDRLKLDVRRSASLVSTHGSSASTWLEKNGQHGHLPVCWAVFSACLGISLPKALFLHLFLQARSLFSSSIRLNSVGPYLAHQIMRFQLRGVVNDLLNEMEEEACTLVLEDADLVPQPSKMEVSPESEREPYSIPDQTTHAGQGNAALKTKPVFRSTTTMLTSAAHGSSVQPLRTGKQGLMPVLDDDESQGWAWDWIEDRRDEYLRSTPGVEEPEGKDAGFWTRSAAPAATFPLGEIVQARHDQLHSRLFNS